MVAEFKYRPLNARLSEIRLLEIHPAADPALPLECTIRHKALSLARYWCLSYVWGDQNTDQKSEISITYRTTIIQRLKTGSRTVSEVEQCQMKIGSSLTAALRHLRHERERVTIWADAICIDQKNKEEKNWQIPLMMRIYSRASSVRAWLGPRYDDGAHVISSIEAAFHLTAVVVDLLRECGSMGRLDDETSWSRACFALAEPRKREIWQQGHEDQLFWTDFAEKLRKGLVSNGLWDRYLAAFESLSQVKYFQRVWILQEAGRARRLTFHYGQLQAEYRLLFLSLCLARPFCMTKARIIPPTPSGARFDSRFLGCLSARMNCSLNCDITKVLGLAYLERPPMHEATDPRDLIYSRLGLASGPAGVKVRYDCGVEHAFISATQVLLSRGFTETLLSFKPYTPSGAAVWKTFPSWAYDWSTKGTTAFCDYRACGSSPSNLSFSVGLGLEMTARGRRLGHIAATSGSFSEIAIEAGIDPRVIKAGNISLQTRFAEANHNANGVPGESAGPIAMFRAWWVKWVQSLLDIANASPEQPHDPVQAWENSLELLLRQASPDVKHLAATARRPEDLMDLQSWSRLVPVADRRSNPAMEDGNGAASGGGTWPGIEAVQSLFRSAWGMRPFVLGAGLLGYGPESARADDEVVILDGVKAPLVLRKDGARFKIVGQAHVCGAMQGELVDAVGPSQKYMLI